MTKMTKMTNPIQHLRVNEVNNIRIGLLGFKHIEVNAFVAQIDTVTLSGASGDAIITVAGGLTKTAIFNTSLTQTATDFVTNHAADYLAQDIVLTSSGEDLIFTADVAGTPFDHPVITNDSGDLDGAVVNTQANVSNIKHDGNFWKIKAVNNDAVVDLESNYGDDISTLTIEQGDEVLGNFSTCAVISGEVLAYYLDGTHA
jgi:hypothetical protein